MEIVFAPTAAEMYPDGPRTSVHPGPLGADLEGASRPTHFAGMLTVVLKLLQIVRPDRAFFGEKDYQQLILVRQMVADLNVDAQIVGVPIVREDDGLAMSSRNRYLDADQREQAGALSAALLAAMYAARAGRPRRSTRRARYSTRCPRSTSTTSRCAGRVWSPRPQRARPAAGRGAAGRHPAAGQHRRRPRAGRIDGHPRRSGRESRIALEELMLRTMLKSKIHRATVTQADLHYVGSVTVDADLMDAADLLEGEQVSIVDIDNGARLVTYAITGERGTGVIGINGAAAPSRASRRSGHPDRLRHDGRRRSCAHTSPGWCSSTPTTADRSRRTTPRTCLPTRPICCRRATVLLAIDVRNTHTVVGLLSGAGDHAKVVQHWRIRTEPEVTADELALTIDGLIGDDSERLTGAAGLSTVPSVLHEVRVMLDQYWPSIPHVLIEPGVRTGIPLLVDNPKEVGADRIVNCLSAFHKFGSAAIVVDFGSSIVSTWCRPRASSSAGRSRPVSRWPPMRPRHGRPRCDGWS